MLSPHCASNPLELEVLDPAVEQRVVAEAPSPFTWRSDPNSAQYIVPYGVTRETGHTAPKETTHRPRTRREDRHAEQHGTTEAHLAAPRALSSRIYAAGVISKVMSMMR